MLINQLFESDNDNSPVANAITRRIMSQHLDLISKYGVTAVINAIDSVTDSVGDAEEIGTSDVSGWVNLVAQELNGNQQGVAEGEERLSIGQQMARDGITYSPEREREIIGQIGDYMAKNGYSNKQIRYYMSYDEDFIPDVLSELPRADQGVAETGYGRSSWDTNMPDWQRREQDSMDANKRAFKRDELEHELAGEEDAYKREMYGTWYLKINGAIYKQKGIEKSFKGKKAANAYALAILKNKPELQGKIFLTTKL